MWQFLDNHPFVALVMLFTVCICIHDCMAVYFNGKTNIAKVKKSNESKTNEDKASSLN